MQGTEVWATDQHLAGKIQGSVLDNLLFELVSAIKSFPRERWPSGLRRTPGKRVGGNASGVRISLSPPDLARAQSDS